MLHFHIPHSIQCQRASLVIAKDKSKKCCGKLAPFSTSFPGSKVTIIYSEAFDYYYGYYFVLYYEAVNAIYIVHEFYGMSPTGFVDKTFIYPGIPITNLKQQYIFVANELKFVHLSIISNVSVRVHDGPGKLSPKLELIDRYPSTVVNFTGSLGYVVATVPHLSIDSWESPRFRSEYYTIEYKEYDLVPLVQNTSQCTLVNMGGQLELSGYSSLFTTSCLWKLDIKTMFNINKFVYSGWDTLLYSEWNEIFKHAALVNTSCQYGGLRIWYTEYYTP